MWGPRAMGIKGKSDCPSNSYTVGVDIVVIKYSTQSVLIFDQRIKSDSSIEYGKLVRILIPAICVSWDCHTKPTTRCVKSSCFALLWQMQLSVVFWVRAIRCGVRGWRWLCLCWKKSKSGNKKEAVKKMEVHSTEANVGFYICVRWIWFLWGRKLYGIWQIMW